jgi:hypothetical protein
MPDSIDEDRTLSTCHLIEHSGFTNQLAEEYSISLSSK